MHLAARVFVMQPSIFNITVW